MNLLAPETIDLTALPTLPLGQRWRLPNICCIYFVLDAQRAILYIGKSNSLRTRFAYHEKLKRFQEALASIVAWCAIDEEDLLQFIEEDCIAFFKPPLNRKDFQYRNDHQVPFSLDHRTFAKVRYYMKKDGVNLSVFIAEQLVQYVQNREV